MPATLSADDLLIEAVFHELLHQEDVAVEALREAVTWRQVALVALGQLQAVTQRAERLDERLRQTMGIETWHEEQRA